MIKRRHCSGAAGIDKSVVVVALDHQQIGPGNRYQLADWPMGPS